MNEINKQERLKVAAKEEGEGRKVMTIKAAEAKAARTRIEAAADADAKHLAGDYKILLISHSSNSNILMFLSQVKVCRGRDRRWLTGSPRL